jgi:hypothetical protein
VAYLYFKLREYMCAFKYKLKKVRETLDSQDEEKYEKIDASEILKSNLEKQEANKEFIVTEGKSRRRRDYITLMLVVNIVLLIPILFQPTNIFVIVYCISGMILLSGGLTWIIWVVMSDY